MKLLNLTLLKLKSNSPALHLFERSVDIVTNGFDLQLLVNELIFNLVDPDVQSLNVHLRVLGLCLSCLQSKIIKDYHGNILSELCGPPVEQLSDLFLIVLLSGHSFLLAHLKLLQVIADHLEFLLELLDLLLFCVCPFISSG